MHAKHRQRDRCSCKLHAEFSTEAKVMLFTISFIWTVNVLILMISRPVLSKATLCFTDGDCPSAQERCEYGSWKGLGNCHRKPSPPTKIKIIHRTSPQRIVIGKRLIRRKRNPSTLWNDPRLTPKSRQAGLPGSPRKTSKENPYPLPLSVFQNTTASEQFYGIVNDLLTTGRSYVTFEGDNLTLAIAPRTADPSDWFITFTRDRPSTGETDKTFVRNYRKLDELYNLREKSYPNFRTLDVVSALNDDHYQHLDEIDDDISRTPEQHSVDFLRRHLLHKSHAFRSRFRRHLLAKRAPLIAIDPLINSIKQVEPVIPAPEYVFTNHLGKRSPSETQRIRRELDIIEDEAKPLPKVLNVREDSPITVEELFEDEDSLLEEDSLLRKKRHHQLFENGAKINRIMSPMNLKDIVSKQSRDSKSATSKSKRSFSKPTGKRYNRMEKSSKHIHLSKRRGSNEKKTWGSSRSRKGSKFKKKFAQKPAWNRKRKRSKNKKNGKDAVNQNTTNSPDPFADRMQQADEHIDYYDVKRGLLNENEDFDPESSLDSDFSDDEVADADKLEARRKRQTIAEELEDDDQEEIPSWRRTMQLLRRANTFAVPAHDSNGHVILVRKARDTGPLNLGGALTKLRETMAKIFGRCSPSRRRKRSHRQPPEVVTDDLSNQETWEIQGQGDEVVDQAKVDVEMDKDKTYNVTAILRPMGKRSETIAGSMASADRGLNEHKIKSASRNVRSMRDVLRKTVHSDIIKDVENFENSLEVNKPEHKAKIAGRNKRGRLPRILAPVNPQYLRKAAARDSKREEYKLTPNKDVHFNAPEGAPISLQVKVDPSKGQSDSAVSGKVETGNATNAARSVAKPSKYSAIRAKNSAKSPAAPHGVHKKRHAQKRVSHAAGNRHRRKLHARHAKCAECSHHTRAAIEEVSAGRMTQKTVRQPYIITRYNASDTRDERSDAGLRRTRELTGTEDLDGVSLLYLADGDALPAALQEPMPNVKRDVDVVAESSVDTSTDRPDGSTTETKAETDTDKEADDDVIIIKSESDTDKVADAEEETVVVTSGDKVKSEEETKTVVVDEQPVPLPSETVILKEDVPPPAKTVILDGDIISPPSETLILDEKEVTSPSKTVVLDEEVVAQPSKAVIVEEDASPPQPKAVVLDKEVVFPSPKAVVLDEKIVSEDPLPAAVKIVKVPTMWDKPIFPAPVSEEIVSSSVINRYDNGEEVQSEVDTVSTNGIDWNLSGTSDRLMGLISDLEKALRVPLGGSETIVEPVSAVEDISDVKTTVVKTQPEATEQISSSVYSTDFSGPALVKSKIITNPLQVAKVDMASTELEEPIIVNDVSKNIIVKESSVPKKPVFIDSAAKEMVWVPPPYKRIISAAKPLPYRTVLAPPRPLFPVPNRAFFGVYSDSLLRPKPPIQITEINDVQPPQPEKDMTVKVTSSVKSGKTKSGNKSAVASAPTVTVHVDGDDDGNISKTISPNLRIMHKDGGPDGTVIATLGSQSTVIQKKDLNKMKIQEEMDGIPMKHSKLLLADGVVMSSEDQDIAFDEFSNMQDKRENPLNTVEHFKTLNGFDAAKRREPSSSDPNKVVKVYSKDPGIKGATNDLIKNLASQISAQSTEKRKAQQAFTTKTSCEETGGLCLEKKVLQPKERELVSSRNKPGYILPFNTPRVIGSSNNEPNKRLQRRDVSSTVFEKAKTFITGQDTIYEKPGSQYQIKDRLERNTAFGKNNNKIENELVLKRAHKAALEKADLTAASEQTGYKLLDSDKGFSQDQPTFARKVTSGGEVSEKQIGLPFAKKREVQITKHSGEIVLQSSAFKRQESGDGQRAIRENQTKNKREVESADIMTSSNKEKLSTTYEHQQLGKPFRRKRRRPSEKPGVRAERFTAADALRSELQNLNEIGKRLSLNLFDAPSIERIVREEVNNAASKKRNSHIHRSRKSVLSKDNARPVATKNENAVSKVNILKRKSKKAANPNAFSGQSDKYQVSSELYNAKSSLEKNLEKRLAKTESLKNKLEQFEAGHKREQSSQPSKKNQRDAKDFADEDSRTIIGPRYEYRNTLVNDDSIEIPNPENFDFSNGRIREEKLKFENDAKDPMEVSAVLRGKRRRKRNADAPESIWSFNEMPFEESAAESELEETQAQPGVWRKEIPQERPSRDESPKYDKGLYMSQEAPVRRENIQKVPSPYKSSKLNSVFDRDPDKRIPNDDVIRSIPAAEVMDRQQLINALSPQRNLASIGKQSAMSNNAIEERNTAAHKDDVSRSVPAVEMLDGQQLINALSPQKDDASTGKQSAMSNNAIEERNTAAHKDDVSRSVPAVEMLDGQQLINALSSQKDDASTGKQSAMSNNAIEERDTAAQVLQKMSQGVPVQRRMSPPIGKGNGNSENSSNVNARHPLTAPNQPKSQEGVWKKLGEIFDFGSKGSGDSSPPGPTTPYPTNANALQRMVPGEDSIRTGPLAAKTEKQEVRKPPAEKLAEDDSATDRVKSGLRAAIVDRLLQDLRRMSSARGSEMRRAESDLIDILHDYQSDLMDEDVSIAGQPFQGVRIHDSVAIPVVYQAAPIKLGRLSEHRVVVRSAGPGQVRAHRRHWNKSPFNPP